MSDLIEILLVEDNPGDIRLCKEALKESKVLNNLHISVNGEDALDFLLKKGENSNAPTPDLILLDLNIPKISGKEVLANIKNNTILSRIPVVILTSSSSEKDIAESYGLHANAYVVKPLDFEDFIKIIKQINEFWLGIVKLPPHE